jgi:hypothetical protein
MPGRWDRKATRSGDPAPPPLTRRRGRADGDGSREVAMRLTIVLLGHTLDLSLEPTATEDTDPASDLSGGTTSSYPVGYAPPWGDQRWQPGADHGAGEPEDRRGGYQSSWPVTDLRPPPRGTAPGARLT